MSGVRRSGSALETLCRTKIDISRGLLDPKHRKKLGEAWHLYLNLLDRKPQKTAWVYGRRRTTLAVIAMIAEVDERTARAWLLRLEREGYITIQRFHGRKGGIRIHISKPKDWVGGELKLLREQTPRADEPRQTGTE